MANDADWVADVKRWVRSNRNPAAAAPGIAHARAFDPLDLDALGYEAAYAPPCAASPSAAADPACRAEPSGHAALR